MALRKIRLQGDEVLAKVSRPVEKMTPRIHDLIGICLKPCMMQWELASRHHR